jgi:hypothetical protein
MSHSITLTGGHQLIIDAEDRPLVETHVWHAIPARGTFYAQASVHTSILLHRLLLDPPSHLLVDHKNRNGLDNRRSNLRLATHSQNHANRPAPVHNTSGYKGVFRTRSGRWMARVTVDRIPKYLGLFDTAEEAAAVYNDAALEAWGEFALLNQVSVGEMPAEDR